MSATIDLVDPAQPKRMPHGCIQSGRVRPDRLADRVLVGQADSLVLGSSPNTATRLTSPPPTGPGCRGRRGRRILATRPVPA